MHIAGTMSSSDEGPWVKSPLGDLFVYESVARALPRTDQYYFMANPITQRWFDVLDAELPRDVVVASHTLKGFFRDPGVVVLDGDPSDGGEVPDEGEDADTMWLLKGTCGDDLSVGELIRAALHPSRRFTNALVARALAGPYDDINGTNLEEQHIMQILQEMFWKEDALLHAAYVLDISNISLIEPRTIQKLLDPHGGLHTLRMRGGVLNLDGMDVMHAESGLMSRMHELVLEDVKVEGRELIADMVGAMPDLHTLILHSHIIVKWEQMNVFVDKALRQCHRLHTLDLSALPQSGRFLYGQDPVPPLPELMDPANLGEEFQDAAPRYVDRADRMAELALRSGRTVNLMHALDECMPALRVLRMDAIRSSAGNPVAFVVLPLARGFMGVVARLEELQLRGVTLTAAVLEDMRRAVLGAEDGLLPLRRLDLRGCTTMPMNPCAELPDDAAPKDSLRPQADGSIEAEFPEVGAFETSYHRPDDGQPIVLVNITLPEQLLLTTLYLMEHSPALREVYLPPRPEPDASARHLRLWERIMTHAANHVETVHLASAIDRSMQYHDAAFPDPPPYAFRQIHATPFRVDTPIRMYPFSDAVLQGAIRGSPFLWNLDLRGAKAVVKECPADYGLLNRGMLHLGLEWTATTMFLSDRLAEPEPHPYAVSLSGHVAHINALLKFIERAVDNRSPIRELAIFPKNIEGRRDIDFDDRKVALKRALYDIIRNNPHLRSVKSPHVANGHEILDLKSEAALVPVTHGYIYARVFTEH